MPITFEEVTAEVPTERPGLPEAQSGEDPPMVDLRALDAVRQALALRAERDWRLHTD